MAILLKPEENPYPNSNYCFVTDHRSSSKEKEERKSKSSKSTGDAALNGERVSKKVRDRNESV